MRYKILQNIPGHYVWQVVTTNEKWEFNYYKCGNYPDFFAEVKEPKTIYDLKVWDTFYCIRCDWITKEELVWYFSENAKLNSFTTEREAKRNKLLRELATRTDKLLPDEREFYTTYNDYMKACTIHWNWKACDMIQYHMWLIFRDEQEYNKYMTEEAKDLLFNI